MSALLMMILRLSLAGGVTCLVCLAVSTLLRNRMPKSWIYGLWLIVAVSFLAPVPLTIRMPVSQLRIADAPVTTVPIVNDGTSETDVSGNAKSVQAPADNQQPAEQQAPAMSPIHSKVHIDVDLVLMIVWIAGACGMLLWNITGYWLTAGRLKKGRVLMTPSRVPVYECARITTPLLVGLFRPVIYLPKDFHNPELAVLHELCHWRRGDIWSKWFIQLIVCIHWFNPMAHLMKRELNRLSELACDEAIIRNMDAAERQAYGQMLVDTLRASSSLGGPMIAVLGNKKKWLRERLVGIMDKGGTMKKSVVAMAALVVCILGTVVLAGGFATGCSAVKTADQAKSEPSAAISPSTITATSAAPSSVPSDISYSANPSADADPGKIYVLDEKGTVVQKDASEENFTPGCASDTKLDDTAISDFVGYKVVFPETLLNGFKLQHKTLGVSLRKRLSYTSVRNPELNDMLLKAITDESAFSRLSEYDPSRDCAAYYTNGRGIYFITVGGDGNTLVPGPNSVGVDIDSISGIWQRNPFPIYHYKAINGQLSYDLTQPPYQIDTRGNLWWKTNGVSYFIGKIDESQVTPLTQEEAVEFAKAFMAAQGDSTTGEN